MRLQPPVTRVFSSPLVRCVQTAAGVCDSLDDGALLICVEPSLRETAGEDWYRSWAVDGSDGTWGGPQHCREGVAPKTLLPEAEVRSSGDRHDWLCADLPTLIDRLATAEAGTSPTAASRLEAAAGYQPFSFEAPMVCEDGKGHSWGQFESEQMQVSRLGRWFDHVAALYPDETVLLVSHGGPSASLFRHSQKFVPPEMGWKTCKYCGLYSLKRTMGGTMGGDGWEVLLEVMILHQS